MTAGRPRPTPSTEPPSATVDVRHLAWGRVWSIECRTHMVPEIGLNGRRIYQCARGCGRHIADAAHVDEQVWSRYRGRFGLPDNAPMPFYDPDVRAVRRAVGRAEVSFGAVTEVYRAD
jgi:hypothetical protein